MYFRARYLLATNILIAKSLITPLTRPLGIITLISTLVLILSLGFNYYSHYNLTTVASVLVIVYAFIFF